MGYANRVLTIQFPELSENQETDPIRVTIRNPRLMSMGELQPKDIELDGDGKPVDDEAAQRESFAVMARLIIGWRVYDPTAPIELDGNGEVVGEQPLLPQEFTADTVAKLPMAIINRLSTEMAEAVNPQ
jgi:hypothetical protein